MAVEDFGGKVLGQADRRRGRGPSEQAGHPLRHWRAKWFDVDKVDMIANLINSSIALTVSQLAKEKEPDRHHHGSGASRP